MPFNKDGSWYPPDMEEINMKIEDEKQEKIKLEKEKLDKAKSDNNFVEYLTSDYDIIKADTDKDGKVSLDEFKNYLVYSKEHITPTIKENHYYIHFDYPTYLFFYILIGGVCVTAMIVTWIRGKYSSHRYQKREERQL